MTQPSILLTASLTCSLAACLSIDAIPLEEKDASLPEEETREDAALADASAPPRDGYVLPPIVPTPPDGSAPVPDAFVPAPGDTPCVAGSSGPCVFSFAATHGEVLRPRQVGDYVYWMESGTTDALNNYNKDGAIVRTKLGEWQREELAVNVDLRRGARQIDPHFDHFVQGDYFFFSWGEADGYKGQFADYRPLHSGPSSYQEGRAFVSPDSCVVVGHAQYCAGFPDPQFVWKRDLQTAEPFAPWFHGECGRWRTKRGALVCEGGKRIELPGTELKDEAFSDEIIAVVDGHPLVHLEGRRIGAQRTTAAGTEWRAITGSAEYLGYLNGWIYIVSDYDWHTLSQEIRRVRLDGSEEQLIATVAESPLWDREYHFQRPTSLPTLSTHGIALGMAEGIRFIPFPAE